MKLAPDALKRARRRWGEAALDVRRETRARGLPVAEWLDEQAGQRKGAAVVNGLARMSDEMSAAGMPLEEIVRRMTAVTLEIVHAVHQRDQHGPSSAA
jgi:hypothetical protein